MLRRMAARKGRSGLPIQDELEAHMAHRREGNALLARAAVLREAGKVREAKALERKAVRLLGLMDAIEQTHKLVRPGD